LTRYYIHEATPGEFWLGENVPATHLGQVIGHSATQIAGPFISAEEALDALAETSTSHAVELEAELRKLRPDWFQ
jgi:hypothetical protein